MTANQQQNMDDYGKLLLRLTLGVLILFHGVAKIFTGPPAMTALAAIGLPEWVSYLAYIGEIVAPALIVVGLFTRPAALIVAINMVFAVILVHTTQFFTMTKSGGWALELQGFYFFTALVIALIGAGRLSLGKNGTKWGA